MKKTTAIKLLGGDITAAAKAIGITYAAVHKWPEVLSPRVEDRVHAAVARLKQGQAPARIRVKRIKGSNG